MKRILSCLSAVFILLAAYSQDSLLTEKKKFAFEGFFNISDAITRATGNSTVNNAFEDPILIGFKVLNKEKNQAFRFGTNFTIVSASEQSRNFVRDNVEQFYSLAAGYEIRKDLGKKLEYYYGIDARYFQTSSTTELFSQLGNESLNSIINGPGIAPLLGFRWNITDRITLKTEGSIGIELLNHYRYVLDYQGYKSVLEDKLEWTVRPVTPGAIFFSFRF